MLQCEFVISIKKFNENGKMIYFRIWVSKYPKIRKSYQYPTLAYTFGKITPFKETAQVDLTITTQYL